jgi:hypothetical protein
LFVASINEQRARIADSSNYSSKPPLFRFIDPPLNVFVRLISPNSNAASFVARREAL